MTGRLPMIPVLSSLEVADAYPHTMNGIMWMKVETGPTGMAHGTPVLNFMLQATFYTLPLPLDRSFCVEAAAHTGAVGRLLICLVVILTMVLR